MNWNAPERRKEAKTVSEVITYELVGFDAPERQNADQQRRRDEWLDVGHRALFAVVVVVVLWLGMWIFWEPLEYYWPMAFVVAVVFTFQPMIASINHRNRTASAGRALHDLNHAQQWQTQTLALQRTQHAKSLFAIQSQTEVKQLSHRVEQRQIIGAENADMDSEYFLTCINRGESPAKRRWQGRTLPSGAKMTASLWSTITAQLESQGILVRDGNGSPYRLAQPAAPQAGTDGDRFDGVSTLPR